MSAPRLPVVLLWHMHQPQYRDALTGQYALPWTYLHAIKDYTDMAAHLEAHASARAVVNFTPVLLEQLEDLTQRIARHLGRGDPLPDPVLALLGSGALPQGGRERAELLRACLRAHRQHMIERFAPYLELAGLAEPLATPQRAGYASDQLLHDLAVWYHLAWMGESVRHSDVRIAALAEQGHDFSARQRRELLALVGELIGGVIPRFGKLRAAGRCELSVSPYSHPIVPLLIDFRAARESWPGSPLPSHAGYPGGAERADWQIAESLRVFTRCFGAPPAGCWPSEGAVSAATLQLLEARGFKWAASSDNVLRASLAASAEAQLLDRPYHLPGGRLACFFRDDRLSDLIGFTYATWHGDDAARNLVHELTTLARSAGAGAGSEPGAGSERAVLIALDGENAWEHYPFNGYYFLDALYAGLAAEPSLELTTLSDCLARGLEPLPLAHLRAGSWVHGTFSTWMGDAAKNAAWDLLCEAKQAFDGTLARGELADERRAAAERQLALCEGSDWFWWFGDYNPRESVRQFDELYRRQLGILYELLGRPAPASLSRPLSVGAEDGRQAEMEHGGVMRRAFAK
ncbi:MAG: glycoside hydrolase [Steroidobacteraceae bacterium]